MADDTQQGEAQCLVSEFPNPPPYYKLFANLGRDKNNLPPPPPIPVDKLEATAKEVAEAAAAAKRAREEAAGSAGGDAGAGTSADQQTNGGGAGGRGGEAASAATGTAAATTTPNLEDVVSIFGEIVEDPLLRTIDADEQCHQPNEIATTMRNLNESIMRSFVKLARVLVHEPITAKDELDSLSRMLVKLLDECNRYREHQAREALIECLQGQLEAKRLILKELDRDLTEAEKAREEVVQSVGSI